MRFILFCTLAILIFSCSPNQIVGPEPGTILIAYTYELPVSDTAIIIQKDANAYKLLQAEDSCLKGVDTIFYDLSGKEIKSVPYLKRANLCKRSSSLPGIKEYYLQNREGFYFLGYSVLDSLQPFEVFDKPLIILPKTGVSIDTSTAIRNIWLSHEQTLKEETKTTTKVKLLQTGKMLWDNKEFEFSMYKLKLSADAKMSYGDTELIIPDAIAMESKICYDQMKNTICEWSVRSRPIKEEMINDRIDKAPAFNAYLEFTIYKTKINKPE